MTSEAAHRAAQADGSSTIAVRPQHFVAMQYVAELCSVPQYSQSFVRRELGGPGVARYLCDFIRGWSMTILNDPEVATHHSPEGWMSTVLDLVLSSPSLEELGMESSLEISFDSASSLDHALLTWALSLDAVQVDTFTSN